MEQTIPLRELITTSKGKKPIEVIDEYRDGYIPYLTAAQLLHGEIKQWAKGGVSTNPSDVLISWDGTVGNVGWGITGIIGSTIGIISPDLEKVDVAFLGQFLLSKRRLLNDTATGATIKHIRRSALENLKFPNFSLEKQRKIAAILDRTEMIKQSISESNRMRSNLPQSIFKHMFGEQLLLEDATNMIDFGEIILEGPNNGIYIPSSKYGAGTKIFRIDSYGLNGDIFFEKIKKVRIDKKTVEKYVLFQHDILLNRVNSRSHIGKVCLISERIKEAVFESNLMRIRINKEFAIPEFIFHQLMSGHVRKQILQKCTDSINQSSINQKAIKSIRILLPDIRLQEKFCALCRKIDQIPNESLELAICNSGSIKKEVLT